MTTIEITSDRSEKINPSNSKCNDCGMFLDNVPLDFPQTIDGVVSIISVTTERYIALLKPVLHQESFAHVPVLWDVPTLKGHAHPQCCSNQ